MIYDIFCYKPITAEPSIDEARRMYRTLKARNVLSPGSNATQTMPVYH